MIGLLFSGQGSQVPGLGKDLYENYACVRDLYDHMDLSSDLKEVSFFADQEIIDKTKYTQPVLVAFHLAILRLLKEAEISYQATAGLSLGEYSAMVASGVLEEKEALAIIEKRGLYMGQACEKYPSTMLAVLKVDEEEVDQDLVELEKQGIQAGIANLNAPGQVVIGCLLEDQEKIISYYKEKKKRCIALQVEGAFHTPFMEEAAHKLRPVLDETNFSEAKIPLYLNRTGGQYRDENLAQVLEEQIFHRTRFQEILEKMIDAGVDQFIEVGKKDTFKGFLKRINKDVQVIAVHSVETYIQALEELKRG